jgi:hypothetical protein
MSEEMTNPIDEQIVQTEEVESQESTEENFDDVSDDGISVEDDSEEVEHEGQKYRVPKALKPALMMQSDYTKKTQEVAETRKALEAREQSLKQQAETQQRHIVEVAKLVNVSEQLEEYQKIDWDGLNETDPVRAQQLWINRSRLIEAQQALAGNLQQREQESHQERQRERAKRIDEGRAYVAANIKDWSQEFADKLTVIGREMGYSEDELQAPDIRTLKLLHRAYLGDQILKKQRVTQPKQPTTQAKPVTQVSGNAPAKKSPSQMSDKEFAAWRRKQISQRN